MISEGFGKNEFTGSNIASILKSCHNFVTTDSKFKTNTFCKCLENVWKIFGKWFRKWFGKWVWEIGMGNGLENGLGNEFGK